MKTIETPAIAIVGFSGVFPKAFDGSAFWDNIASKVDAAAVTPAQRWIAATDWVFHAEAQPDLAYSRHGCHIRKQYIFCR